MERLEQNNLRYLIFTGPVILLVIGSIISPFSFVQLIIVGIAYLILCRLIGKERAYVSFWVGTILMWSSVFITYNLSHTNNPLTLQSIVAVSGFPITALYYPVPPMGSNIPPWQMWPAFYFDYAFWIAVAVLASKPITTFLFKKRKYGRPFMYALPLIGLGFMLAGFLHILISFD